MTTDNVLSRDFSFLRGGAVGDGSHKKVVFNRIPQRRGLLSSSFISFGVVHQRRSPPCSLFFPFLLQFLGSYPFILFSFFFFLFLQRISCMDVMGVLVYGGDLISNGLGDEEYVSKAKFAGSPDSNSPCGGGRTKCGCQ